MACDAGTLRRIVNNPSLNPSLSPAQKARAYSIEAENALPYPQLDADTQAALDARVICDMYEGHAPYKPRPCAARLSRGAVAWEQMAGTAPRKRWKRQSTL